ncbi:MAG: hypothetical protein JJU01_09895 [Alkalibacterium sp.]|nr:hypothetical protein [Alkalibacterium sp.]
MMYYYGTLIFTSALTGLILAVFLRLFYKLLRHKEKQRWWLYIALSTPVLLFSFYHLTYVYFLDLPNAIRGETLVVEGAVETVYFPGGDNAFVIDGTQYRKTPRAFSPEEGKRYRLDYLPNSRYVVEYVNMNE